MGEMFKDLFTTLSLSSDTSLKQIALMF